MAAWLVPAQAASIEHLDITRSGARYQMQLSATLDAPAQNSFAVFEDFSNLPKINDAIEAVELLTTSDPAARRVRTKVRVCVWLFCVRLNQVQDVRKSHRGEVAILDAVVLPALSNLRFGEAHWQMQPCGEQTCLTFRAELEPDFWVPPGIGPWAIKRTMRREAVTTANGIERLAHTLQ
jgi:hypothetical protein